jgi:hypothetical protein
LMALGFIAASGASDAVDYCRFCACPTNRGQQRRNRLQSCHGPSPI